VWVGGFGVVVGVVGGGFSKMFVLFKLTPPGPILWCYEPINPWVCVKLEGGGGVCVCHFRVLCGQNLGVSMSVSLCVSI